jgi:hypothetical protein
MYLLVAVAGSVVWMSRSSMVVTGYAPTARILLIVVVVGMCVLWPMVRLSQASARQPVAAALADLLVVLAPAQVVIWPLSLMAAWPIDVVAAVAMLMLSWSLVACAVVAVGGLIRVQSPRDPRLLLRSLLMTLSIALIAVVPVAMELARSTGRHVPAWGTACSPLSGIWSITGRGLSGAPAPVTTQQWGAIGITGCAGLAAVVLCAIASARHRNPPGGSGSELAAR